MRSRLWALIAARVLSGLAHGVFFSVGAVIATNLVPKEKAASAIATMFSGLTLAFVTGVPLGTMIGQHFGWRATFLVVAGFGLLAMVGALLFVPGNITHARPAPLRVQAQLFMQPRLLLVFAITAIGYGGSLIAFTYLALILEQISGFSQASVGIILLAYGASVAFGNWWGGKLADARGPVPALTLIFGLLASVLMLLHFTAPSKLLVFLTVLAWGAVAFGNVPVLQVYVVRQAERLVPQSVSVASGVNIAAFNLGVAGGAGIGGHIVRSLGVLDTTWIASLVVLVALALTLLSGRMDRRQALPSLK